MYNCKCFEPRSIGSLSSVFIQVSVVLKRTVVVDINWCFNNLSISHFQSHVNCELSVDDIRAWLLLSLVSLSDIGS